MRQFITLFFSLYICIYSLSVSANGLTLFSAQEEAQNHCPYDEVVWLNLPTGIWHTQGQHWYGATQHGAYVCKEEATMAGDRASLNDS